MSKSKFRSQSRRKTPWDSLSDDQLTPLQLYLRDIYHSHYDTHHLPLHQTNEITVLDKYKPYQCPYCGSDSFVRNGKYKSGLTRYTCKECNKSFCITTGTIFQDHKISISEWLMYLLNLFDYVSLRADSKNNGNAFTTSRYWLQKVFLVLEEYQNDIILKGDVYLDETFYSVRKEDIVRKDGKKLRGISGNQMCIGAAADSKHIYCKYEGLSKPDSERTLKTFVTHIQPGSHLVHDEDVSHKELVETLCLKESLYRSEDLKNLEDVDNPLDRINKVHFLLKLFLDSHSGFLREDIQGYIDLFVYIMNPPSNKLKKANLLLERALQKRVTLRYRDFYKKSED